MILLAHKDPYVVRMMGTNYIGAFALTKVLQPLLEKSPTPARIVNVSSFTHWNGKIFIPISLYLSASNIYSQKNIISGQTVSC